MEWMPGEEGVPVDRFGDLILLYYLTGEQYPLTQQPVDLLADCLAVLQDQ